MSTSCAVVMVTSQFSRGLQNDDVTDKCDWPKRPASATGERSGSAIKFGRGRYRVINSVEKISEDKGKRALTSRI